MPKDVHTEHCCIVHGCKYSKDEECTVMTRKEPQSFPCESCGYDGIDPTKGSPETNICNFRYHHYYKLINKEGQHPALLYVMGLMRDAFGDANLICNIFLMAVSPQTFKMEFVSSIQGTKLIKKSEWEEIPQREFEALRIKYTEEAKQET
jgi:hypothetical protein